MLDTDWKYLEVCSFLQAVLAMQFHWENSASSGVRQKEQCLCLDKIKLENSQKKSGTLSCNTIFFDTHQWISLAQIWDLLCFAAVKWLKEAGCNHGKNTAFELKSVANWSLHRVGIGLILVLFQLSRPLCLFFSCAGNQARAVQCWCLVVMGN